MTRPVTLQEVKEIFDIYESHREVRHIELRDSVRNLTKTTRELEEKVMNLQISDSKSEGFTKFLYPILTALITTLIIAGITNGS